MTDLSPAPSPRDVIDFWRAAGPDKWFAKDDAFDAEFRHRFEAAHFMAARRELDAWADTAEGMLALMILLDQLPRNTWRGTGHAYATDSLALHFARRAIERGDDREIEQALRRFLYLPFQHSEALADQERSLALFATLDREPDDNWAEHHHGVVARFGRFPHRNRALGRETAAEEEAFLKQDGFTG